MLRHKIQGGKLTINTVVEELVEEGGCLSPAILKLTEVCRGDNTAQCGQGKKKDLNRRGFFHWMRCWEDPWKRKRDLNT